jgi:cytoskeletal protein RodZ
MRDTVKTLAGLVIIAVIVVATFLYGNAQRQAQLKHDQQIKDQQAKTTTVQLLAKASPDASAKPTSSSAATPSASSATNTAPVETPQSNSLQGGATPTPTPKPTVTPVPTPAPSPVVAYGGPSATPLPQTGSSSLGGMFGVAAIVGAILGVRYSRRSLLAAVRERR